MILSRPQLAPSCRSNAVRKWYIVYLKQTRRKPAAVATVAARKSREGEAHHCRAGVILNSAHASQASQQAINVVCIHRSLEGALFFVVHHMYSCTVDNPRERVTARERDRVADTT